MKMRLAAAALALACLAMPARAEVGETARALFEALQENVIRGYFATARETAKQEVKRQTIQSRRNSEATVAESDPTYDESLGKGAAKQRQQALKARGGGFYEDIPAAFMPPPGKCRLWLPDTPPGRQPKPSSCARALDGVPAGARVIYGGPEKRNAKLPRGLGDVLPADLLAALGLGFPETEMLLVDDDVYLIDQDDGTILDILERVLLPE